MKEKIINPSVAGKRKNEKKIQNTKHKTQNRTELSMKLKKVET
jgi:hypothetical protein